MLHPQLAIIIDKTSRLLEDMLLGGSASLTPDLVQRINLSEKECKQVGLTKGAELLAILAEEAQKIRRDIACSKEVYADAYFQLSYYLEGIRKAT